MKSELITDSHLGADLHTHPPRGPIEIAREVLSRPGIRCLSTINERNYFKRGLCFEEAVDIFPDITILESGSLAKLGEGYIARGQEVQSYIEGNPERPHCHIIGIGLAPFEGEYLPNHIDPREAAERILKSGGVPVVAHPGVMENKGILPYRKSEDRDMKVLEELFQMLRGKGMVENGNAQCRSIGIIDMSSSNGIASKIAPEDLPRLYSSDARAWDQVDTNQIYLSKEDFCLEKMLDDLVEGRFIPPKETRTVSLISFLHGVAGYTLKELNPLIKPYGEEPQYREVFPLVGE